MTDQSDPAPPVPTEPAAPPPEPPQPAQPTMDLLVPEQRGLTEGIEHKRSRDADG
jgi:hypothetical protein